MTRLDGLGYTTTMFQRLLSVFGKDLAMDLGTANTLIHITKKGIVLNEPSVVALDSYGEKVLAVGAEAKSYMGREPQGIKIVRPLKDGVIADFEVTSRMISHFIQKVTNRFRIVKPNMVIGIPPYITNVEKRAVIDSAHQVGARDVQLVDEAMASAIGAGLPVELPVCNFVVDIGGGTCDVAIISLSGHVCGESLRVAGDEMNEAIQDYVKEKFRMLIGESMAEKIKIDIAAAHPDCEERSMRVSGRSLISGIPETVEITTSQIREAITPTVQAILHAIRRTLEKTPPQLIQDSTDMGILLVGGGALIRGMDMAITDETTLPVNVDPDPLTTCVRGAGCILENRRRYKAVFIS